MLKKLWFLITRVPGLGWARHPGDIYLRLADGREPMPKWLNKAVPWLFGIVLLVAWLVPWWWVFVKDVNDSLTSDGKILVPAVFIGVSGLLFAWLIGLQRTFAHAWGLRNQRLVIVELEGDRYAGFCRVPADQEPLIGELARGHCHWFWGPGPLPGWDTRMCRHRPNVLVYDENGVLMVFPTSTQPPGPMAQGLDTSRMVWYLHTHSQNLVCTTWTSVFRRSVENQVTLEQADFLTTQSYGDMLNRLEGDLKKCEIERDAWIELVNWVTGYFQGTRSIHAHKKVGDLLACEAVATVEDHVRQLQGMVGHNWELEGEFYVGKLPDRLAALDWPGLKPKKKPPQSA